MYISTEKLCLIFFSSYCNSAGIGRTGTYIAIDALHKQGHTKRKINIAEYAIVMCKPQVDETKIKDNQ